MASRKRSSRGSQFASQIGAESELRFGPQTDALAALLKQALGDRDQGLQVQRTTREGLIQAARGAQPAAQQALQSSLGTIDAALQGITPSGLMASDIAATKARLADQSARTATELASRENDAAAGYAAGVRGVQSQYRSDRDKIADQLNSLAGQEGTFGASRLAELLGEDRKLRHDTNQQTRQQTFTAGENRAGRAVTRRGQDLSHQDRQASIDARQKKAAKANAGRLPGGAKLLSPEKHGQFQDQVESTLAWIKAHRGDYQSRHEMAQDLSTGVAASKVTDPDSGQEISDPGVPKAKSQLALSVALDIAFDGKVSRHGFGGQGNLGRLHQRGYSVKRLGYGVQPARGARRQQPARSPGSLIPGVGDTVR